MSFQRMVALHLRWFVPSISSGVLLSVFAKRLVSRLLLGFVSLGLSICGSLVTCYHHGRDLFSLDPDVVSFESVAVWYSQAVPDFVE